MNFYGREPLGILNQFSIDLNFLSGLFSIVLIDLLLAGDNAVVIAMAVRSLPVSERKKGIIFGSAAAVALRVVLTFFVAKLLEVSFIKLAGGVLILWIAVKLFIEGVPEEGSKKESVSLANAVKIIVIADVTMATDNMLAVAGVSHGNFFLLLFGLGLSIPFVVLTSNLLTILMDKYAFIVYIGAAILGKVGAEMIMTDPVIAGRIEIDKIGLYVIEAVSAVGVIVGGKFYMKWKFSKEMGKESGDIPK